MTQDKLYSLSREIVAPALVSYVEWILADASARGVSTLYFLARDGYPLQKIAQMLCHKHGYAIDCRYLYCSRVALRTPSYHIIGEEAYELLFLFGFHVTLQSFFDRAAVPDDLRDEILREMGFAPADLQKELTVPEMDEMKRTFRANARYCEHVERLSRAAYDDTIAYFRQEKLFDQPTFALVDSGWSGSMQRSLRQLLRSAGYEGSILGYYFGMYAEPKGDEDGEYRPWFFSRNERIYNKLFFNNNLFECMLSAPHGMTMGYAAQNGIYGPVLGDMPSQAMLESIHTQLRGIADGANDCLKQNLPPKTLARKAKMRLRRLMACPSRAEADAYGEFLFCDDITERSHYALADETQLACLPEHTLTRRVWRKLLRRQKANLFVPFWIYGTLAYVKNPIVRTWYRINIWAWDALRYMLHKA